MFPDPVISASCDSPSGHSRPRLIPTYATPPKKQTSHDYKMDYSSMPIFNDFSGPYKNYEPPGCRNPAVGERNWGDVPYLPSYHDAMHFTRPPPGGLPDNLYFRGPFYKGVSETHEEYVNRGLPPPRQHHTYTRHYHEPGLKDQRSVTQSDYQPPNPMLSRDRTPCLREDPPETWYQPERKPPKNPHAKELEVKRPQQTEVIYVDEEVHQDLTTEHMDKYVCYHRPKTGSKIQDPLDKPEEIFMQNMRRAHKDCGHTPVTRDGLVGTPGVPTSPGVTRECPGITRRFESWLLHPNNYAFQNDELLMPRNGCYSRDG